MNNDHQPLHSEFQIDHFIVARGNWTPYARYKQALREISKRENAEFSLTCKLEELRLDIERVERRWCFTRQARARRSLELRRMRKSIEGTEATVRENARELKRFRELAEEDKQAVGELTPERRQELDADMWRENIRMMAAVDLLTNNGRLTTPTLELLVSIPPDMRDPILGEIQQTVLALSNRSDGPLVRALLGVPTAADREDINYATRTNHLPDDSKRESVNGHARLISR